MAKLLLGGRLGEGVFRLSPPRKDLDPSFARTRSVLRVVAPSFHDNSFPDR